jgi:hypothetical protein
MLLVRLEVRVETSKATHGRYPMVGFHVLQGMEEVNGLSFTVFGLLALIWLGKRVQRIRE